ncbi:hypothetical protein LCGC14_0701550 [marine sediment metagenome]|uniref:Uncharacterized protein n=1 Tax=marine sediment metagenome TaxID=412755 RepID=A0A0F9R332_9ZZZZ
MIKFLCRLWSDYAKRIDKSILGAAIDKVAKEKGAPQEYTDLAWGIHKVLDPNYALEDLTENEIKALRKFEKKEKTP